MKRKHGQWFRRPELAPWLALLWVPLALCVVLTGLAFSINPELDAEFSDTIWSYNRPARWSGAWRQGTAHENLWMLSTDLQLYEGRNVNALFLSGKRLLPALLLALQLLGLGSGLLLGRALHHAPYHRVRAGFFSLAGITALVTGLLLVSLLIETRLLGVAPSPAQWGRAVVWGFGLGLYFGVFCSLATWIGSRVKNVRSATWMLLSIFVGLLVLEGSRELFWPLSASDLPQVPELPAEVRMSLFRPSGEPRVTEDREEMVADYLRTVDDYSTALAEVVEARYQAERLWSIASPQLVLRELSFQLLQEDRATIADLVYSHSRSYRSPSLRATLAAVWPEAAWLVVLFLIVFIGALRSQCQVRNQS